MPYVDLEDTGILSHREIAKRLGTTHTRVRSLEKRALEKLRELSGLSEEDLRELLSAMSERSLRALHDESERKKLPK